MRQKRTLLFGPRVTADTPTGVSVAFETLIETMRQNQVPISVVNTQWGGTVTKSGVFSFVRAGVVCFSVLAAWWQLLFCQRVYLPLATSRGGFLRDSLIILPAVALSRKVIGHLHGSGYEDFYGSASPVEKSVMRFVMRNVDLFVVLSEKLTGQFSFLPEGREKSVVVANGADFDPAILCRVQPKTQPKHGEPWRFLFLSNLMPTKGYHELANAAKMLAEEGYKNYRLSFCGAFVSTSVEATVVSDPEKMKQEFYELINSHSLKDLVTYHGVVRGDAKIKELEEAHFLILPTYHPWEGQPISIIEAMAFGMPAVTTDHKGISEQIDHGVTGFFVEKQSAKSLASQLRQILDGEVNYTDMSKAAREKYQESFTLEAHGGRMLEVLQSV